MKLSEALASLLLVTSSGGAVAFAPHQKTSPSWNRATSTRIMMSSAPAEGGSRIPAKKVLTAADVIGKANAQGSLPGKDDEKEEIPKLFTKEIYDDFQSALLKLEKRVKDGPGSLSAEEIDAFQGETDRIVDEMKLYLNNPEERKKEIASTYGAASSEESKATIEVPTVMASVPAPATKPPPAPAATQPVAPVASNPAPATPAPATTEAGYGTTDTSLDEGPAFDGKGFGLAKGTTNTYAIPGMDEMSAEEYRAKLQETISARQAQRRQDSLKAREGKIGNANSQSYLDGLSKKGEIIVSVVDMSLSSSSSSSVQKSQAVNEDLINERRVADTIILKTEEEVKNEEGSTEEAENDYSEEEAKTSLDMEHRSSKDGKQIQDLSEDDHSGLKAVISKMENSKTQKDLIRLSECQVSASAPGPSSKSEDVGAAEQKERFSLGQSSGFFVRNDNTRRPNPILGIDPSKKYAQVQDRAGSTTQRTASMRVESVFDRNSVGAIRKSPLKSQAAAQSLAATEMDLIQRPTRSSESPNYETVSGRTTVGDLRKNKPLSTAKSTKSLVDSEIRLRPTPGSELPKYNKIEGSRSVGDVRKSASKRKSSNTPISSLVGSEERQRPTPRAQSSKVSAADVQTFAGDLRKSSNKPLPASSARTSLIQTEKRARPAVSSNMPPHAEVRDRRSVGDFRDPATRKPLSSPTSLAQSEVRQRPTPSASTKEKDVSDSRGVIFQTKHLDSLVNTAPSLVADEVRQRPIASTISKETDVSDSRGVIFKTKSSDSLVNTAPSLIADEVRQRPPLSSHSKDPSVSDSRGVIFKASPKLEPQASSSLIADEVRQRPPLSSHSKDTSVSDSRGVIFKASPKPEPQTSSSLIADEVRQRPPLSSHSKDTSVSDSRGVIFKASPKLEPQASSSLIADEVRQRPPLSSHSKESSVSDSRGVVFKASPPKPEPQTSSSLIADEVRQRPLISRSKESSVSDSRGVIFKSSSSSSPTVSSTTSLIEEEQRQRKPAASTSSRKFAHVEDRTGDARVAAKKTFPQPPPPKPFVADKQTRSPRASTDPRKYIRVENRVGPDVRRPAKEKTPTDEAIGEKSHWWLEKTQRPRAIPSQQPEALERDTQIQSSQVRKSHMKEEKLRREQETFQVPIAELQPSSLKALVKEDRHEEEEKHTKPPPLKMLLNSERPISGVKETAQKSVSAESHLKALLKEGEGKGELNDKRQKRPPNTGDEWWNEKSSRPKGYVKHSQPMNTSYENRDSHLRDYGDVLNQPGSDGTDEEDFHDEDIS